MVQLPVMWKHIILRKLQIHMRYKSIVVKVANTRRRTSKKAQHGPKRHSMEYSSREDTDKSKESSSGNAVPILRQEERRGNIPRVVTLKNSRNPNYPPSMQRLRRGKEQRFGYSD
jgi:hypothetical protein